MGIEPSEEQLQSCEAMFDDARDSAAGAGCSDEHDAFLVCAEDRSCDEDCDSEYSDVEACFAA